ncbi:MULTISPECIES: CobW family GTP-binding protein [Paraburkholderia]|uniref:CobW family GTP-binding protein n=1 Tax=Paraburkholderia TaxID=1822464 RepID=UPI000362DAB1|nr:MULTISPECIES: GTP-binding protein [Paraburkholderia]MDH6147199.1 G3E family GTPase [Paraburkholderia sp. WSM4179]
MSLGYDVLPVTLVTGFLGSGKSTLLADVLHGDAAKDTAVLINEFGEVGLDHLLVGEVDARTVLLDNGCVCCSIRGELKEALATLFSQRARGDLPPFSRVVLETTGLATPAPIVATLLADPVIRSHYALNATVTVVDALNAAQQRARHPEWLAQVSAADRLLISKSDLVDPTDIAALARTLAALNPVAEVVVRASAADTVDRLFAPASSTDLMRRLGSGQRALRRGAAFPGFVSAASAERSTECYDARDEGSYRAWSSDDPSSLAHRRAIPSLAVPDRPAPQDIVSFCMQINEPIDWQVFTIWFTMLLNRHGDKILRVKGLLSIAGCAQPAVLHAVQHLVHPVLHLDAWPDTQRRSKLVFITEGLARESVEASYAWFRQRLEEPHH